jgi:BirA family biotin operon repressor/biotin-[acetyl-CoA-carboxylase] ligase
MKTPEAEPLTIALRAQTRAGLEQLEVFDELDSTNRYLLEQPVPSPGHVRVALANHQTAGRGRLGRHWRTPPGTAITLSIAYTFAARPQNLPGLSLAIGVATVEVLRQLKVREVAAKWPNDILVGDAKLGGILIETRAATSVQPTVVTGLGLNVDLTGFADSAIAPERDAAITDLKRCIDELPSRFDLAVLLIDAMFEALCVFDAQGFAAFAGRWSRCDWLKGKELTVDTAAGPVTGASDGVDDTGALLLLTRHGRRSIRSGSVVLQSIARSAS